MAAISPGRRIHCSFGAGSLQRLVLVTNPDPWGEEKYSPQICDVRKLITVPFPNINYLQSEQSNVDQTLKTPSSVTVKDHV